MRPLATSAEETTNAVHSSLLIVFAVVVVVGIVGIAVDAAAVALDWFWRLRNQKKTTVVEEAKCGVGTRFALSKSSNQLLLFGNCSSNSNVENSDDVALGELELRLRLCLDLYVAEREDDCGI